MYIIKSWGSFWFADVTKILGPCLHRFFLHRMICVADVAGWSVKSSFATEVPMFSLVTIGGWKLHVHWSLLFLGASCLMSRLNGAARVSPMNKGCSYYTWHTWRAKATCVFLGVLWRTSLGLYIMAGWWFGRWLFWFFHILGIIIPIDFHILWEVWRNHQPVMFNGKIHELKSHFP